MVAPDSPDQMLDQEEGSEKEEEDLLSSSDEQESDSTESEHERASDAENTGGPKDDLMSRMLLRPEYVTDMTPPIGFDFESIKSFHHFTSSIHLTLPNPSTDATESYWQARFLPLALSRHWMMSGLLAIAEYHMVALAYNQPDVKAHCERAMKFYSGFFTGRREASMPARVRLLSTEDKDEERIVGGQVFCVIRCAQWALIDQVVAHQVNSFPSYPLTLRNLLIALRSFSLVERNGNVGTPEEVFARAGQIFRRRSQSGALEDDEDTVTLLNRLDQLPSRMSSVFGRPNDLQDVMATLAAIAALVEHYSASFTPDTSPLSPNAVWHSMVSWCVSTQGPSLNRSPYRSSGQARYQRTFSS